jgi:DNA polymerase elongation subunit (family B)
MGMINRTTWIWGKKMMAARIIGKISQEPNAYKVDIPIALAAQQLQDVGIPVHPGEKVSYVIKDSKSKDKAERVRSFPFVGPDDTYDVKKYLEMLVKATEEILIHMFTISQ